MSALHGTPTNARNKLSFIRGTPGDRADSLTAAVGVSNNFPAKSAEAKANVAYGFAAEALFQLSQDVVPFDDPAIEIGAAASLAPVATELSKNLRREIIEFIEHQSQRG